MKTLYPLIDGPLKAMLLTLFLCITHNASASNPEGILDYWQAYFKSGNQAAPTAVNLPHLWQQHEQSKTVTHGQYTINLGEIPSDTPYALFIPKLVMTGAIYLNDIALFEPSRTTEPLPQYWNHPLLIYLPVSALSTENTLRIEIVTYAGLGMLTPFYVGPKEKIEPYYHKRKWLRNELNVYLFTATLAVGLFSLFIGLSLRDHRGYLYFSLSAFFWAFYNLNFFIIEIPVSGKIWWWWIHSCIDGWSICFVLFVHRFTGKKHPQFEQAIVSFGLGASAVYFVCPTEALNVVSGIGHTISICLYIYIALNQLIDWRNTGNTNALFIGGGTGLLILLSCHDLYTSSVYSVFKLTPDTPIDWTVRMGFLTPLAAPVIWISIFWRMIRHYAYLSKDVAYLQLHLETKISQTSAIYETEAIAAQKLTLAELAASERQAIYANLYEDLAEKLSIIFHTATTPQQADAASAALNELRDTAQTDQKASAPLIDIIADIKRELNERCESANINVNWETINMPPAYIEGKAQASVITRIMREALSNTIKHAGAKQVYITLRYSNRALNITFRDDGLGMSEYATEGRGIVNMRRRAGETGGELHIQSSAEHGTSITMVIPCEA